MEMHCPNIEKHSSDKHERGGGGKKGDEYTQMNDEQRAASRGSTISSTCHLSLELALISESCQLRAGNDDFLNLTAVLNVVSPGFFDQSVLT